MWLRAILNDAQNITKHLFALLNSTVLSGFVLCSLLIFLLFLFNHFWAIRPFLDVRINSINSPSSIIQKDNQFTSAQKRSEFLQLLFKNRERISVPSPSTCLPIPCITATGSASVPAMGCWRGSARGAKTWRWKWICMAFRETPGLMF